MKTVRRIMVTIVGIIVIVAAYMLGMGSWKVAIALASMALFMGVVLLVMRKKELNRHNDRERRNIIRTSIVRGIIGIVFSIIGFIVCIKLWSVMSPKGPIVIGFVILCILLLLVTIIMVILGVRKSRNSIITEDEDISQNNEPIIPVQKSVELCKKYRTGPYRSK